ncbi:MAG TPA: complex I NDUFA9 subunit family protein [Aliidongia sp.]|nr:complex I NDUFA9 subunit family protein [Aliidongia sp.]
MTSIRRVTVFGGSGFIGRYIVQRLARQGAAIAVVSRRAGDALFLQPMGDVGQIALVNAHLGEERKIRAAIEGADTVVSLVGILAEKGRQRFEAVQHQGAAQIARLAAEAGVSRLLHVSAIGANPNSDSGYARTKAEAETAIRAAFPKATILRPSIVFGPEDQFFNRFAELARNAPHIIPLIGGGKTRFQPVYVGDVADAAIAALAAEQAQGRTYELGGPEVQSFRALMEMLVKEVERPRTHLVSVPTGLASLIAAFAEWAPKPPLTRDQVRLLKHDNVVAADALTLRDLGVAPTAMELILPFYLSRYRPGGWFTTQRA